METLEVDIALLPVSGTYVMDPEQAVAAALAIDPKYAIPMHYGKIVGSGDQAAAFKTALEDRIRVHICEPP
jgi:L-ascorbate metabolism protein UlaG (beta-lactamase superfamily)